MKTIEELAYKISDWGSVYLSLAKLAEKKVVDVKLSIGTEFGDATLKVHSIIFEDGSTVSLSGEHDIAYLEDSIIDQEELETLNEQIELFEAEASDKKIAELNAKAEKSTVS